MRKVLLLIVIMFVAVTLSAQVGVNVGPKIGYQSSKLSFKGADMESSFNNDLNIGIFTRFSFKRFIIQPELLFSCQNVNNKINNLSVPVLFGFKLVDRKIFKMRANVGPVAYFTIGNTSFKKKMNMGSALGLGLDVWRLTLDINYSFGLTDVFGDLVGVPEAKQNVFVVMLGFKIL